MKYYDIEVKIIKPNDNNNKNDDSDILSDEELENRDWLVKKKEKSVSKSIRDRFLCGFRQKISESFKITVSCNITPKPVNSGCDRCKTSPGPIQRRP